MAESAGRARLIAQILVFKPWNPETDDAHQVSTNYLQCPICAAYNHEPHDDDCALGAAVKLADALAREEPHAENCRGAMTYSDGSRIFPMASCNCRTALAGQEEAPQPCTACNGTGGGETRMGGPEWTCDVCHGTGKAVAAKAEEDAPALASILALIEQAAYDIKVGFQGTYGYDKADAMVVIERLVSAVLASVPPPQEEKELARGGTQADSGHLQSSAASGEGNSSATAPEKA